MNKFSLLENFKNTDEDIEDFFFEYYDKKKFNLSNGFIDKDNRYFTDVANINSDCKECKRVKISIDDTPNGIYDSTSGGRSITDINKILEVISTIKKFYARSHEEVNFTIDHSYKHIDVIFFIVGPKIGENHIQSKETINKLLEEFIEVAKKRGYKRVKKRGDNFVDILTSTFSIANGIYYAINRAIEHQLTENERNMSLIEWCNKVTNSGFRINLSGGDKQVAIKLIKL